MQPSQQFSARRLEPVLMLDLCADNSARPAAGNIIARISELDPRVLVSLGFYLEINGMVVEGVIQEAWIDSMIQGSAYGLMNAGYSQKHTTAIPNLDHEILRPIVSDDGITVEVFGTALKPAVDTIDLVCRYQANDQDVFLLDSRVRVFAYAEIGMENNAPEEDTKAVLDRVRLRTSTPALVGGLYTSE
jgi:hypothetical protein